MMVYGHTAGMDPKEEIKLKIDIAELIGEYLTLKQSGAGSFKALCPFHAEKSPSFHVSTEKQIWHCFGCGKGGDCYAFVMEMDGMDFPEALRHLGAKVGIEVKRYSSDQTNETQRLLAVNDLAGKFFEKVLSDSPSASSVREYVAQRGITPELVTKFGLGYAPDSWDTLVGFLMKRGFTGTEIERAGLSLKRKSGDGWIDRFRARLMIPLRNAHGDIVGFTGRILPSVTQSLSHSATPVDQGPKYMNSPETPIYHKGRLLFGLDLAKRAIKDAECLVVVEGNLDVVASHKAGVEHVVASSGTALTQDQLDLIKRYTKRIVFSFDADAAGFSAAQRGIALARANGFDIRVAVLPPEAGKDPDEAVQKNPELWRVAATNTVPIMQFYIDRAVVGRDLTKVDDKRAVGALLLPELSMITDVVEREHWLRTVADLLRMDMDELRKAVQQKSSGGKEGAKGSGGSKGSVVNRPVTASKTSAAYELIALFLHDAMIREELLEAIPHPLLPTGELSALYKEAVSQYHLDRTQASGATQFFGRLRERLAQNADTSQLVPLLDELSLVGETIAAQLTGPKVPAHARQLIERLRSSDTERRRKAIEADIRRAEAAGDHAEVKKLMEEFNVLR